MNNSLKTLALAATLMFASSYSMAQQYNHGDHNDPAVTFAVNSQDTLNCGSSSLQICVGQTNLQQVVKQWCRDKVTDDSDSFARVNYYRMIKGNPIRILSVTDNNAGTGSYAYTAQVRYTCTGVYHTGAIALPGKLKI